ncbi:MAG: glycosyltransferase family 4 protein [Ignavibacteria bacterium]|nr:glycosyltransferase family 4 protein [Ignavibacteria bacterium]
MKVVISVGGRFHAVALAEQLEKRGYLEKIITTKRWYVKSLFPARRWTAIMAPELLGMAVRKIPALRRGGYYSYVKDNLFDALARKYIPPCDVFHAWGNYALYCIPTARHLGAKVVIERGSTHPHYQDEILREEFERHGVRTERAHPQIIEKGLQEIALADRVIIPSEFVRRTFLANGVAADKLAVIPYGADLSLFTKREKRDNVFRVLFVGNIGVQKGVHYLLEAWKRLALPNAELLLIGRIDEDARPLLERHAGLFTYGGHVPHHALAEQYGNASVFVLPSLQEGSAMVTYEAMACGLPSIVSENTGSILRDGIDGYIVPIRSAEAIADALAWMHAHPAEAGEMGRNAMAYVQAFTWERYADGVVEVYRGLLAKPETAE